MSWEERREEWPLTSLLRLQVESSSLGRDQEFRPSWGWGATHTLWRVWHADRHEHLLTAVKCVHVINKQCLLHFMHVPFIIIFITTLALLWIRDMEAEATLRLFMTCWQVQSRRLWVPSFLSSFCSFTTTFTAWKFCIFGQALYTHRPDLLEVGASWALLPNCGGK